MAYWLFKAEPAVYGIAQLAAEPGQTTRWDGIRNYQARNSLRDQVKTGDQVFLYHSHQKQAGVVGIAQVVRGAYADPAQFDPTGDYFDPRATPESPRWYAVDIQLQENFHGVIPLALLKTQPELSDMTLFRQARLSIQPVTPQEWKTILRLKPRSRN